MNKKLKLETHQSLMGELKSLHQILLPLLIGRKIHYLDIPFYGNVGDLLIMLGTLEFLHQHQINVTKYGTYFNYSHKWSKPNDVIVFQGGGNFGDIYGPFQAFRENVISSLPHNRIIILPQSIHFNRHANFKKCCDTLSQHPDLHICVRDIESEKLARRMSHNVYLLPDMAHQLWPLKRTVEPTKSNLNLRRRDKETLSSSHYSQNSFDWQDLIGESWTFFLSEIAERGIYHAHRIGINKPFVNLQSHLWIYQAKNFVSQAVDLFSSYESVESDRLHAHILSCLLSIPNTIEDNTYGKNSRYISNWTAVSPIVKLLTPVEQ